MLCSNAFHHTVVCIQPTPCALTLKSNRYLAADLPHPQRSWTVVCEQNFAPLFCCLLLGV